MSPIEALMLGAGNRGNFAYGPYAFQHPEEIIFTAIAEPDPERRARFADAHDISVERQFASWEDALALPQLAHAAINCTMDKTHVPSTLALLNAGYDVLLEKPMATTARECAELVRVAEERGRLLQICHVLRFTDFFAALRDIVQSGRLGRIVTIDHRENVSFWHMSHSYVRGNWRREDEAAPMILAKCCHDMDILVWTLGKRARKIGAFGSLSHYRKENAPVNAPLRCTEGCPIETACAWYAPRLYGAIEGTQAMGDFMVTALGETGSPQARYEKLKTSPYGRCVYHCDNDVVDHHVALIDFEDDVSCTFTMHGHSHYESRTMRWDGTHATLEGEFYYTQPSVIRVHDHGGKTEAFYFDDGSNHGGGDIGIVRDFVRALNGQPSPQRTSARVSLESHLMCFAAEDARKKGEVVEMGAYRSPLI
jgi:predicted dehydrogenase